MKVTFEIIYPAGARMRCGIDLPDPPTADAIREVARVFMQAPRVIRLLAWDADGQQQDLLIAHLPRDDVLNERATAIIRESLHRRTGMPLDELGDAQVFGIAVVVEPSVWPA